MVFKFTAKIVLDPEGFYVFEVPAFKGLRVRGMNFADVVQQGEYRLKRHLEDLLRHGESIPEDVKEISVKTEDLSEVIILKMVVSVDNSGFITA